MTEFKTLDGEEVRMPENLKLEHVLQRHRDVWVVIDCYPFLAIDYNILKKHYNSTEEYIVFSQCWLLQNMRKEELGRKMLQKMFISGTDAGIAPEGNHFVEGQANPEAFSLLYWNRIMDIGCHAFSALNIRCIYVSGGAIYQRTFGKLSEAGGLSTVTSDKFDFSKLSELTNKFHSTYINGGQNSINGTDELNSLLDQIFHENAMAHDAALEHHRLICMRDPPVKSYKAPLLTKYGRLVHDAKGNPCVQISYALLHYERALREFNHLKEANVRDDVEAAFSHGAYCVVATAACIEAIVNNLVFAATGTHPNHKDIRQPLQKLNESAESIAIRTTNKTSPAL